MPISPLKSRDLADENNKILTEWKNYFICIKDFNAETNTSLKLNLFSFFMCGCQHQRKMICLSVYISDITQTVRY
jgi:hypothetical protein